MDYLPLAFVGITNRGVTVVHPLDYTESIYGYTLPANLSVLWLFVVSQSPPAVPLQISVWLYLCVASVGYATPWSYYADVIAASNVLLLHHDLYFQH